MVKIDKTSVYNIDPQKRNGFFVECGAYDGEAYSNSLLFELGPISQNSVSAEKFSNKFLSYVVGI
jgi:hypothetical protein